MSIRRNPPRKAKDAAAVSSAVAIANSESKWFPEIKGPTSKVHQQINKLNLEAYPSEMFARADSLLVFSAFISKGKKRRHHHVKPQAAQFFDSHPPLSKEDGILGAHICHQQFNGSEPNWDAVIQSVDNLQHQILDFHSDQKGWSACLRQYAYFYAFIPPSPHFSISLLYRYSLLYSSDSSVCIGKVTHSGEEASFGLKATRDIPDSTFIIETCSSMSLDCTSAPGISVIQAGPSQLGPVGPRLILGPFRFVNHDCKPNAQVSFTLYSSMFGVF